MIRWRARRLWSPGLLALALLLSAAVLPAATVLAAGEGDPPVFRNARNQFTVLRPREPAPMTPILTADGDLLDLGRYRGKVVLLNFWATWCVPCVGELPALDRLQSTLGGRGLEVVALSIDDTGIEAPAAFVRRLGLTRLNVYLDFTGAAAEAFPLYGLPISYLIDRDGLLVGYLVGAAAWDSPEAARWISYYLDRAGGGMGSGTGCQQHDVCPDCAARDMSGFWKRSKEPGVSMDPESLRTTDALGRRLAGPCPRP